MIKLVKKYYFLYEEFWLYSIGGGLGFVIDFGLLYLLTEFANLWYLASATVSVTVAIIFNYSWQRNITFKSNDRNITKQFSKFIAVSLTAVGLNILLLYLLVDIFGLWYLLAKIFVTAVLWTWNFVGNKYFTFRVIEA